MFTHITGLTMLSSHDTGEKQLTQPMAGYTSLSISISTLACKRDTNQGIHALSSLNETHGVQIKQ